MSILDNEGHDPQGFMNRPSRSDILALLDQNSELRQQIVRLRAALRPFAASAYDRDGLPDEWEIRVTLGDLRRARSALNQQNAGEK